MRDELRQINILFHAFLGRMFDFELLSTGADAQNLFIQFAALIAAFNFVLTILLVPRYAISERSHAILIVNAWHDEEFLIATTLAITGFLMILAWETLFPDRRDCVALGVLPVRTRTVLLAKLGAIGSAVATSVLLVNVFTSFCYPLILLPPDRGALTLLRTFRSYWLTMGAAGLFMACAILSIQGITAQLLPYRVFLRVSSFLQLVTFFLTLIVYFLKPPLATPGKLLTPQPNPWLLWVPSYWFFGLFHKLNGSAPAAALDWLALRSVWALLAAFSIAALTYAMAYGRNMRRIIEQPDIAPAERSRPAARFVRFLQKHLLKNPLQRAVALFIARTLQRSRQHRLLVAFYGGIGLALALTYSGSLVENNWKDRHLLNASFLTASFVLLFFAILAVRAAFSFPFTLPANWIFRLTAVHRPAEYLEAARKSLFSLAAIPIWIVCALLFFAIWPNRTSLAHIAILLVIGTWIVERSLLGFRKIPFACSYVPGKANLKVTLALYGSVILFVAGRLGDIEAWAIHGLARYATFTGILIVIAATTYRRRAEFANAPHNSLQFEDVAPGAVFALDLSGSHDLTNDDEYIAAQDLPRSRWKTAALTVLLLATLGFIYEQFGRWRDRKLIPQMGRSVDIGGRSLNIYCSGRGSPTVIFEGNWGSPGYSWLLIQREVAKLTRACWYDRAGYGWSDEGPFPNHSDSIARDLHALLTKAGVACPYVLAAHAMGAFHSRVYRGFYPNEIAGMVLIDPMNEDMTIHIHNHIEALRPTMLLIRRVLGNLGLERLMFPGADPAPRSFTDQEWNTLMLLRRQLKSRVAEGKEPPMWINGELARESGGFGDIPVVVLSAGIQDQEEDPKLDHDHLLKLELHRRLANLSTHGTHLIVADSGHEILFDDPEAVINAVNETVMKVRGARPSD